MGRGSSGKASANSEKSITLKDGTVIDLSENPLEYGSNSHLDGDVKKRIEEFEAKRRDNLIEYGYAVDANGKVLEEKRGGKGSVSTSYMVLNNADVYTHVHPRDKGAKDLSGTFSEEDLRNWSMFNVRVFRATGREGTYSIAKEKNFNASGARQYFHEALKTLHKEFMARRKQIQEDYNKKSTAIANGTGDYKSKRDAFDKAFKSANEQLSKAFNKELVGMHKAYINGQKKYGYSYSLERRK